MSEFIDTYGTEAKCEAALQHARWPDGFVCPECGAREHSPFPCRGRRYWQGAHCRTQTTLRSGTLFHASRLPLITWFQAIYLVTQNKNDISALSLKRHLGVSYRTAWRMKHKLLEARPKREDARPLAAWSSPTTPTWVACTAGKRGRSCENKVSFIAAVEIDSDGHPQPVRFDPLPDLKATSVVACAGKALDATVRLVTDGLASLAAAAAVVAADDAIILTPHGSSGLDPFRWVNTFIASLKTGRSGAPTITLSSVSRRAVTWRKRNTRLPQPALLGQAPPVHVPGYRSLPGNMAALRRRAGWLKHGANRLLLCLWTIVQRALLVFPPEKKSQTVSQCRPVATVDWAPCASILRSAEYRLLLRPRP